MNNKIKEVFCIWCDLLGYGQPFINSNWNLYQDEAIKNFDRICSISNEFRSITTELNEKSLILNDGFIRSIDIDLMSDNAVDCLMWLEFTIKNFYSLNILDKRNGYPGARGVLTFGHRYSYMHDRLTMADITQSTKERLEELSKTTLIYSPNEFQMNTAFSKAYIMESAGSRAGIKGSYLYIDIDFLNMFETIILNKRSYFLLTYNESLERIRKGLSVTKKGEQITKLKILKSYEEDKFIIRYINNIDDNDYEIFALIFRNKPIEFNDKGINTKLYKLLAFTDDYLNGDIVWFDKD